MTTTTYAEYNRTLAEFARRHNEKSECKIYTSPMENNRYHKEYCWEDGANWFEVTELVRETVEVESHGMTFKTEIEYWKTEYWSTEFGSRYVYQK